MSAPSLRPELEEVVRALLAASEDSREVTLDQVGDAIGVRAVSTDEIELVFLALESQGRRIVGPEGAAGEERLRRVVQAARELTKELGRRPTVAEICERSGLVPLEVKHALALAKVMQR